MTNPRTKGGAGPLESPRPMPAEGQRHMLVTGAGGFVGRVLCAHLAAQGIRITELTRASVEIGPQTDWPPWLEGVTDVVHLAARVHVMNERLDPAAAERAFMTINAEAAGRLAHASAAAGVRRFVFVSSVKAAAERSVPGHPLEARDPPAPEDAYGRSKLAGEKAVASAASAAMAVSILRPPMVYGPGVRANFLALMRALDRGLPLPLGALRNRRSVIHVDNLAAAIAACLLHQAPAVGTWYVADGAAPSVRELGAGLAKALGRPDRLLPVPPGLLDLAGRLLGRRATAERLTGWLEVDTAPFWLAVGQPPPLTFEAGLASTAAWYRSR